MLRDVRCCVCVICCCCCFCIARQTILGRGNFGYRIGGSINSVHWLLLAFHGFRTTGTGWNFSLNDSIFLFTLRTRCKLQLQLALVQQSLQHYPVSLWLFLGWSSFFSFFYHPNSSLQIRIPTNELSNKEHESSRRKTGGIKKQCMKIIMERHTANDDKKQIMPEQKYSFYCRICAILNVECNPFRGGILISLYLGKFFVSHLNPLLPYGYSCRCICRARFFFALHLLFSILWLWMLPTFERYTACIYAFV